MEENNNNNNSDILQFYENKTVFITGATGFLGKVLVEKLLRSTNVAKVLLLIRPKKDVETTQRLADLLLSAVFDRIRQLDETLLHKIEALNGDIAEENLGLDSESEEIIKSEVNIIFHSAATVRLDEDLTKSVAMNVQAVSSLVSLARQINNLEALVDVSTAYCNCDLKQIQEKIYPAPLNPRGIMDICRMLEADKLNSPEMTAMIIGSKPNTYTFTKALAENILQTEGAGLPISIIRPSIVAASWREPMPGWVDNFNAATGIFAWPGSGVMRTAFIKRECVLDLVPVDLCINLMCVLAWKTATSSQTPTIPVYHCTSGAVNTLTYGVTERELLRIVRNTPSTRLLWYPDFSFKQNYYTNRVCQLIFHYGPAHLVDIVLRILGKKPFLVKISSFMQKSSASFKTILTNSWEWSHDNMDKLWAELSEEDRQLFHFDIRELDWTQYLETYVKGIRKFLFKENSNTISASERRMTILFYTDLAVKGLFLYGIFYFLYSVFSSEI